MSPAELLILAQARKTMAEALAIESATFEPTLGSTLKSFDVEGAFEEMAGRSGELMGSIETSTDAADGPLLMADATAHPHGGRHSLLGKLVDLSTNVPNGMQRIVVDIPYDRERMPMIVGSAVTVTRHER